MFKDHVKHLFSRNNKSMYLVGDLNLNVLDYAALTKKLKTLYICSSNMDLYML